MNAKFNENLIAFFLVQKKNRERIRVILGTVYSKEEVGHI